MFHPKKKRKKAPLRVTLLLVSLTTILYDILWLGSVTFTKLNFFFFLIKSVVALAFFIFYLFFNNYSLLRETCDKVITENIVVIYIYIYLYYFSGLHFLYPLNTMDEGDFFFFFDNRGGFWPSSRGEIKIFKGARIWFLSPRGLLAKVLLMRFDWATSFILSSLFLFVVSLFNFQHQHICPPTKYSGSSSTMHVLICDWWMWGVWWHFWLRISTHKAVIYVKPYSYTKLLRKGRIKLTILKPLLSSFFQGSME